MKQFKHWQDPVNAVLGLWMVMSPWMLGFSHLFGATVVVLTLGMAVVVLSLWTLATDKKFSLPRSMLP